MLSGNETEAGIGADGQHGFDIALQIKEIDRLFAAAPVPGQAGSGNDAGQMWRLPGGVPHQVIVGNQPMRVIEAFCPVREDFRVKGVKEFDLFIVQWSAPNGKLKRLMYGFFSSTW